MKIKIKLFTGLLFCLIAVLLAASASAAVQITESEVKLNVDYNVFNKDDQTKMSATTDQFTLTNDQSTNVTARIEVIGLPSSYTVTSKDVAIPASGSATASLTLDVPHDKDGGSETIGTIKVSINGVQEDTAVLKQVTQEMLIIKELEVRYTTEDGDTKRESFDEDKTEIKLGKNVLINTEITLDFNIRNRFDNDYDDGDAAIESIELDIEADDSDLFSDEPEDTYDLEDLDADEKQDFPVTFTIDSEAESGEHTITITLTGEDGKGAKYEVEKELKFEVERKKDDARIASATLIPAVVTSCDKSFSLDVELKNYGTDDQKHAGFSVYNEKLGINENIVDIELEEFDGDDNSWNRKFTFNLKNVLGGDYYLDLRAYVELDESTDSKMVKVSIGPCGDDAELTIGSEDADSEDLNDGTSSEDNIVAAGTDSDEEQDTAASTKNSSDIIKSIERAYSDEDLLVGGIIVVIVLLVAMVALFVAIIIKK